MASKKSRAEEMAQNVDTQMREKGINSKEVDIEAAAEEDVTAESVHSTEDPSMSNPFMRELQDRLLFDSLPPIPVKRSKREEADAFFAFTQRLTEELGPGSRADRVADASPGLEASPASQETAETNEAEENETEGNEGISEIDGSDEDRASHEPTE